LPSRLPAARPAPSALPTCAYRSFAKKTCGSVQSHYGTCMKSCCHLSHPTRATPRRCGPLAGLRPSSHFPVSTYFTARGLGTTACQRRAPVQPDLNLPPEQRHTLRAPCLTSLQNTQSPGPRWTRRHADAQSALRCFVLLARSPGHQSEHCTKPNRSALFYHCLFGQHSYICLAQALGA